MPKPNNIKFPLDSFLERLALEGIETTLPQRLQLLAVLQHFGRQALEDPARLKYRIAPIVARNATQQKRVYALFDEFVQEAQAYRPLTVKKNASWQRLAPWHLALIATALLLIPLLIFWLDIFPAAVKKQPLQANFSLDKTEVVLGETIRVTNQTLHADTTHTTFQWRLIDREMGTVERDTLVQDAEWEILISDLGASPEKFLRLMAIDTVTGEQSVHDVQFRIICADPPDIPTITAPAEALVNTPISIGIAGDPVAGLDYKWSFGEGQSGEGVQVEHRYTRPGAYEIQVRAIRTFNYCEAKGSHFITIISDTSEIGEKAYLAELPLLPDPEQRTTDRLNFYWMSWVLLGLLLGYALFQFWRWLRQEPPPEQTEEDIQDALQARFKPADKGPYNIPFENEESAIRVEENLFRLADQLRRRQEAGRMVLDVAASVSQTVEKGGFPVLLEKRTTLPPEYLFLIDEQSEHSHQAALYHYLVRFLRDKDVFITAFWYHTHFHNFWNADFPDGISLQRMQQLFPTHRLLVLGDGHALIDPSAEALRLKQEHWADFTAWDSRLLITPLPPASWTYKEATLYQLFPVFDSKATGFAGAMRHLETLAEEQDEPGPRPSFTEWQGGQTTPPKAPDINFLAWKRSAAYTEYLQQYPELYRWCCALAVYPNPNWNLSLAIGRAIGAPVNFDNLLLLARIPWLQGQPLHPKLRQELLDALDPETERIARTAVQRALLQVAPQVEGSHANQELQLNLAIQSFLLDPTNGEHQATIRHLQQHGLLGKKQLLELEGAISRKTNGEIRQLDAYLEALAAETVEPIRKAGPLRFNGHFYRALAAGLGFIVLVLLMFLLNGSPVLTRMIKGPIDPREETPARDPLTYGYFFKDAASLDSASIYNNLGVEAWITHRDSSSAIVRQELERAIRYFARAESLRPNYHLAQQNSGKAYFNQGMLIYNDYLEFNGEAAELENARHFFALGQRQDSSRLASLHGLGLCAYYLRERESAQVIYDDLVRGGFFDLPRPEPNLKTLLYPVLSPEECFPAPAFSLANELFCAGEEVVLVNDGEEVPNIRYYLLDWGDGRQDSLTTFTSIRHRYTQGNRWTVTLTTFADCNAAELSRRSVSRRISRALPPQASIITDRTEGCPPLVLDFAASAGAPATYRWRVSALDNPQPRSEEGDQDGSAFEYTFSTVGDYEVWLYQSNPCGADSTSISVRVLSPEACAGKPDINRLLAAADSLIYRLEYAEALEQMRTAVPLGERRADVVKSLMELAYFYNETGRTDLALGIADTVLQLRNSGPAQQLLDQARQNSRPRTLINQSLQTVDAYWYSTLEKRYYPEMVLVKGGTFCLGQLSGECDTTTYPLVTLSDYRIARTETTAWQFSLFAAATGYVMEPPYWGWSGDNPVVNVSWYDGIAYANWLSGQRGLEPVYQLDAIPADPNELQDGSIEWAAVPKWSADGFRLPTEAEWEYAARGGGQQDTFLYSGSPSLDLVGWYRGNSAETFSAPRTHPVSGKLPNALGLYDMSGNVFERCWDWDTEYPTGAVDNPTGPIDGSYRIVRGGDWESGDYFCEVSDRFSFVEPYRRSVDYGFRLSQRLSSGF